MLYIPRNRKLEIAPRFSRAHQTRTGRNIHDKQGRVLSPFFSCSLFFSSEVRTDVQSDPAAAWAAGRFSHFSTAAFFYIHKFVLIILHWKKKVKKLWEPGGKVTASTSPVRCARGPRALSLHCYETERRQKRKIKHRDFRGAKPCPTSAEEALR